MSQIKQPYIKICGLTRLQDIYAVNELKPDFIGFVFAPSSKRYLTYDAARALKEVLLPDIMAVGVFVDAPEKDVIALLNDEVIDMAQLHGSETNEYIAHIQEQTGKPVIQAFQIHDGGDIDAAKCSQANYILLDSGSGSGETFNWSLVRDIDLPYFLAGGLSPENISTVLKSLTPYAVDVSSGVETCGVKDKDKMKLFIDMIRER